jgi:hypothetical protein
MSLECAVELDALNNGLKDIHKPTPVDGFNPKLYRQPALAAEDLAPERYRNPTSHPDNSPASSPLAHAEIPKPEKSRLPSVEGVSLSTAISLMHTDTSPIESPTPIDYPRRAGWHFLLDYLLIYSSFC